MSHEIVDAIDQALDTTVGLHGTFVIAFESYDATGEPVIRIAHHGPTAWTKLGLARALSIDLEASFRAWSEDD